MCRDPQPYYSTLNWTYICNLKKLWIRPRNKTKVDSILRQNVVIGKHLKYNKRAKDSHQIHNIRASVECRSTALLVDEDHSVAQFSKTKNPKDET